MDLDHTGNQMGAAAAASTAKKPAAAASKSIPSQRHLASCMRKSSRLLYGKQLYLTQVSIGCRSRRTKCDAQRPICGTCSRTNALCEYYDPTSIGTLPGEKPHPADGLKKHRLGDFYVSADGSEEFHQRDLGPPTCPRCGWTSDSPAEIDRHLGICKGRPATDDDDDGDSSDSSSGSSVESSRGASKPIKRGYVGTLGRRLAAVELGLPVSPSPNPSIGETSFMGDEVAIAIESRPIEPPQGKTKAFVFELVELLISNYTFYRQGATGTEKENNPKGRGSQSVASQKTSSSTSEKRRAKRPSSDRGTQDDSGDQEEDDQPPDAKRMKGSSTSQAALFACPFAKYDPERYSERNQDEKNYRGCASKYLNSIPRVKQHLYRVHARPSWYCGNCYKPFKNRDTLNEHSRQRPPCQQRPVKFEEMMTDEQFSEIKRRKPGVSGVDSWYQLFHILFPGAIEPATPYVSRGDPVAVQHFVNFFRAVGPSIMFDQMQSWKAQNSNGVHLDMSTETIIDEAFEITLPRLLGNSEAETNVDDTVPIESGAASEVEAASSPDSSKNPHAQSVTPDGPDHQEFSAEDIWAPDETEGAAWVDNLPLLDPPEESDMHWSFNEFEIHQHFQTYGGGEATGSQHAWHMPG